MGRDLIISILVVLLGLEPALVMAASASTNACPPSTTATTSAEEILKAKASAPAPVSAPDLSQLKTESSAIPAANAKVEQDWEKIANLIFQTRNGESGLSAETIRASQELKAKYGKKVFYVAELLTHYERWNNSKFKAASNLAEVPMVFAERDASLAVALNISGADLKKSLREVLIEKLLKTKAGDSALVAADQQIEYFFDKTLSALFDEAELLKVYSRLNELPESAPTAARFLSWKEMSDLNDGVRAATKAGKTSEEIRTLIKAKAKTKDLNSLSFAAMTDALTDKSSVVVAAVPVQPPGPAKQVASPASIKPAPAVELKSPSNWQAVSNILFATRGGIKNLSPEIQKAYADLSKTYGQKSLYYITQILNHYERWNNQSYANAASVEAIPPALANIDSELAKTLEISKVDPQQTLRQVLVEQVLKSEQKRSLLAKVDQVFEEFFGQSLGVLFDQSELPQVFNRLNQLPNSKEARELFVDLKQMQDLNRFANMFLFLTKPEDLGAALPEFRKQVRERTKSESLVQVSTERLTAGLVEVLGPRTEEAKKLAQEKDIAAERAELNRLMNGAEFQSNLYVGGRVSDQMQVMGIQRQILKADPETFDPFTYRRELGMSAKLQEADAVDSKGREKYRLVDESKLPPQFEFDFRPSSLIYSPALELSSSFLQSSNLYNLNEQNEQIKKANESLEKASEYSKYSTREVKLKHLLAAGISKNSFGLGALLKKDEILLTYSLDDLSRLHFIRQTIRTFPLLQPDGQVIATKDLEAVALKIVNLKDRLKKLIGSEPDLRFETREDFESFVSKVTPEIEGISAVAPGVLVTRFGFGGRLMDRYDRFPNPSESRPMTIREFTETRHGSGISNLTSERTVLNDPSAIIGQLAKIRVDLHSRQHALAKTLTDSWQTHRRVAFPKLKATVEKSISETRAKLATATEKVEQDQLREQLKGSEEFLRVQMPQFEGLANQFTMTDWTLPQLEALEFLVKRYGNWDEAWFETANGPNGKESVLPVSLLNWAINFDPQSPTQTGRFLVGVQHAASAEGIFLTIFGSKWKEILKLTADGKRPSPGEMELQLPLVNRIIQKLQEHQDFALRFYSQDLKGRFVIPKVKWAWARHEELLKFLDNPEGIDPNDPKNKEKYKNRIRVPTDEAHVNELLAQMAELRWGAFDKEARGEKVVAADRLKPLIQTQLNILGGMLSPQTFSSYSKERAQSNLAHVQEWPSKHEQLSDKIARGVTTYGLDYDAFIRLIAGMMETARNSKLSSEAQEKELKNYQARILEIIDQNKMDVEKDLKEASDRLKETKDPLEVEKIQAEISKLKQKKAGEILSDPDFQNLVRMILLHSRPDAIQGQGVILLSNAERKASEIVEAVKASGSLGDINSRSGEARKNFSDQRRKLTSLYKDTHPEVIERTDDTRGMSGAIPQTAASIPEEAYLGSKISSLKNATASAIQGGLLDHDIALNQLFGEPSGPAALALREWFGDLKKLRKPHQFGKKGDDKLDETEMSGYTYSALRFIGFPMTADLARLLNEKDSRGTQKHKLFAERIEENGKTFFESGQKLLLSLDSNLPGQMNRQIVLKMIQKMGEDAKYRERLVTPPPLTYDRSGVQDIADLLYEVGEYDFFQRADKKAIVEQLKDLRRFLIASHQISKTAQNLAALMAPKVLDRFVYEHPNLLQEQQAVVIRTDIAKSRLIGLSSFLGVTFGGHDELNALATKIAKTPDFDFDQFLEKSQAYVRKVFLNFENPFTQLGGLPTDVDEIVALLPLSLKFEKSFEILMNTLKNQWHLERRHRDLIAAHSDPEKDKEKIPDLVWSRAFASPKRSLHEQELIKIFGAEDSDGSLAKTLSSLLGAQLMPEPAWFADVDGLDEPFVYYRDQDPYKAQFGAARKLGRFIWQDEKAPVRDGSPRELREDMILAELFNHQARAALIKDIRLSLLSRQTPQSESIVRNAYALRTLARDLETSLGGSGEHLDRAALSAMVDRSFELRLGNLELRTKLGQGRQPPKNQEELTAFNKEFENHKDYKKVTLIRHEGAFNEADALAALMELGDKEAAKHSKVEAIRKQLELVRDLTKNSMQIAGEANVLSERYGYRNRMAMELNPVVSAVKDSLQIFNTYRMSPEAIFKRMNHIEEVESRLLAAQMEHSLADARKAESLWNFMTSIGIGGLRSARDLGWGAIDDALGTVYNIYEAGYYGVWNLALDGSSESEEKFMREIQVSGAWNEEEELAWNDFRRHSFFTHENLEHSKRKLGTFAFSVAVFALAGMAKPVEGLSTAANLGRMGVVEKTLRTAGAKIADFAASKGTADAAATGAAKVVADGAAQAAAGTGAKILLTETAGSAAASAADPLTWGRRIYNFMNEPIYIFGKPAPVVSQSVAGAMREAAMQARPPLSASTPLLESTKFNFKRWGASKLRNFPVASQKLLLESAGLVLPGLAVQYAWSRDELGNNLNQFGVKVGDSIGSTIVFLIALGMVHRGLGGMGAKAKSPWINRGGAALNHGLSFGIMHHIGKNFVAATVDYGDLVFSNRISSHAAFGKSDGYSDGVKQDRQVIANFYSQLLNMGYIVGSPRINEYASRLDKDSWIRKRIETIYAGQGYTYKQVEELGVENFTKNLREQIKQSILSGKEPAEVDAIRQSLLEKDQSGRTLIVRTFEVFTSRKATDLEVRELHKLVDETFEQGIVEGENARREVLTQISAPAKARMERFNAFMAALPPVPANTDASSQEARREQIENAYREAGLSSDFFFITREGQFERDVIVRRLDREAKEQAPGANGIKLTAKEFERLALDLALSSTRAPVDSGFEFGARYEIEPGVSGAEHVTAVIRDSRGELLGYERGPSVLSTQPIELGLTRMGLRFEYRGDGSKAAQAFVKQNGNVQFITRTGAEFEISGEPSSIRVKKYGTDGKTTVFRSIDEAREILRGAGVTISDYNPSPDLPIFSGRDRSLNPNAVSEVRTPMEYDIIPDTRVTGTMIVRKWTNTISETLYPDGSVKGHIKTVDGKIFDIPLPRVGEEGRDYWIDKAANQLVVIDRFGFATVVDGKSGEVSIYQTANRSGEPITTYTLDQYVSMATRFALDWRMQTEEMVGIFAADGGFKGTRGGPGARGFAPSAEALAKAFVDLEISDVEGFEKAPKDQQKEILKKAFRKQAQKYHPDANANINPRLTGRPADEIRWKEVEERFKEVNAGQEIIERAFGLSNVDSSSSGAASTSANERSTKANEAPKEASPADQATTPKEASPPTSESTNPRSTPAGNASASTAAKPALIPEIQASSFQREVLDSNIPVLVFYTRVEYCSYCEAMKPHVEDFAKKFSGRVKVVNVRATQENVELLRTLEGVEPGPNGTFQVGFPQIQFFSGGMKRVGSKTIQTLDKLETAIGPYLK